MGVLPEPIEALQHAGLKTTRIPPDETRAQRVDDLDGHAPLEQRESRKQPDRAGADHECFCIADCHGGSLQVRQVAES